MRHLRRALSDYFRRGRLTLPDAGALPDDLLGLHGVFVTLRNAGELRGCIGNIDPRAPLAVEAVHCAISSATEDYRFAPLSAGEVDEISIEVSVLSPFVRVDSTEAIVPGVHGVLVRRGLQRGLFLPQVWDESGWSKEKFLAELCVAKAGMPAGALSDAGVEWYVFTVQCFASGPGNDKSPAEPVQPGLPNDSAAS